MLDRPHPAGHAGLPVDAADNVPADAAAPRVQMAALDGAPPAASFDSAASTVGLSSNLLSNELAQLMQVPVSPEPVSGERAVLPSRRWPRWRQATAAIRKCCYRCSPD